MFHKDRTRLSTNIFPKINSTDDKYFFITQLYNSSFRGISRCIAIIDSDLKIAIDAII
jgi:hypothetical protein